MTSEVFLSLVSSLKQFRAKSSFSTWLYTIIKRKVADYYRQRANKGKLDELLPESQESSANSAASEEERIMVRETLRRLPERYREVLFLRFVEDLPFKEIATTLNLSLDAAKSLYRRAIIAARHELEIGKTGEIE